ncbi:MAG: GMC family oxidoreductase N-terminal domain-containing protein [Stellaceae bacterium]
MGSVLGLGSVAAQAVTRPTGRYDVIIVGGGTAGAIVAARLQAAGQGMKRILIIEAGGPTAAAIGGADFPPWLPRGRRGPTIFDVPGEYSQIAHMPLGAPYQLTETAFTFQGIGLGGNSMFNGMLFQTNPKEVFDNAWPKGWQWNDLWPHFDRVRQRVPVSNTPSPDGIAYNTGPARIAHPLYAAAGWVSANTSLPFRPPGVYSRPYVATTGGRRAGPISGYFGRFDRDGEPSPGLEILLFSKADQIAFDTAGTARAVHYKMRSGLDQSLPATPGLARLRSGGLLVLAAGALATPRLLLLSGIGPSGREAEIFPHGPRTSFAIDNPRVGVGVFDHVLTMVTYDYGGPVPYRAYDYGDYAGNAADLRAYLASGRGPYAQYQPVSILNYASAGKIPDVEIFLNPNGAGAPGGLYYGPSTLSAFVMLLDPKARGIVSLDAKGNVIAPNIYLPATPDGEKDTALMTRAVADMIRLFARDRGLEIRFGPGGPSHPKLNPDKLADIRRYVTGPSPAHDIYFNRLIVNHFGGTAALSEDKGGVDPKTLILRGTSNVAVVDASLLPAPVTAHPVGTIMAVADRAGGLLARRWA